MDSLRRILVGVLMGSAAAFGYLFFIGGFIPFAETDLAVPETQAASVDLLEPARLIIPELGLDARVEKVGLNAKGDMAVPRTFTEVGWYRHGAVPGETGSAVMAAHVDNGLTADGVFKDLEAVHPGYSIFVETEEGTRARFIVEEVSVYAYDEVPLEKLFNRADKARLNLVTCTGKWLPSAKMYNERLVVYAVLADP